MNCLSGLIGVKKTCSTTEPVSGLYVNDLPGMSLKNADAAANSEKTNGVTLIQDRINFASKYLANDFRKFLQDKFVINSLLESSIIGHYSEDNSTIAASNKLRGIKINVREDPYLNINISRIGIRFEDSIDTEIYIYDLYKNELLYTIPVHTESNETVYIQVNKKIPTNRQKLSLFICTDASLSDHYKASVYTEGTNYGCKSCGKGQYLSYATSGTLDPNLSKTESNFNPSSSTGGITLDYTIECDMDNYICSMSNTFAWPLLWKTGFMIMQELINSDQLNTVVMIKKDSNEELMAYYDAEYIKSMNDITKNLKLPKDICFQCSPSLKVVNQIP